MGRVLVLNGGEDIYNRPLILAWVKNQVLKEELGMDKQTKAVTASVVFIMAPSLLEASAQTNEEALHVVSMKDRLAVLQSTQSVAPIELDATHWVGRTAYLSPEVTTILTLPLPSDTFARLDFALEGNGERIWVTYWPETGEFKQQEGTQLQLNLKEVTESGLTLELSSSVNTGYYLMYSGHTDSTQTGELNPTAYTLALDATAPTAETLTSEPSDWSLSGYRLLCAGLEDTGSGIYRVYQKTWLEGLENDAIEADATMVSAGVWEAMVSREAFEFAPGIYHTELIAEDRAGNQTSLGVQTVDYSDWTIQLETAHLSKNGTLTWSGNHYYPAYLTHVEKTGSYTELRGVDGTSGHYLLPLDFHYSDQSFNTELTVNEFNVGRYELVHKITYQEGETETPYWATPEFNLEGEWVGFGNGKLGRLFSDEQGRLLLEIQEDLTEPTLTLTPSTTETTSDLIRLTVNMEDEDGTYVSTQTPSGTYIFKPETSYITYENGLYTFEARDLAGNTVAQEQLIENYADWVTESPISLYYRYQQGGVLRDWTKAPASGQLTISAEGASTIYGQARDEAGNLSDIKNTEVRIDLTKPKVSVSIDDDYVNSILTLNFNATDAHSGIRYVEYKLSTDADWTRLKANTASGVTDFKISAKIPSVNGVQLEARAVDWVGHVSDVYSETLYFDRTAPEITFKVNPNWESLDKKPITVQVNDPQSGLASLEFVYMDHGVEPITSIKRGDKTYERTLDITQNNGYTIGVSAVDVAGNATGVVWVDILKDNEVPVLSELSILKGGTQEGNKLFINKERQLSLLLDTIELGSGLKETQLMLSALTGAADTTKAVYNWTTKTLNTQAGSGFKVSSAKEESGALSDHDYLAFTLEALRPGVPYVLSYRLTDVAGNTTGDKLTSYQIVLDNIAPTITLEGNEAWTKAESTSFSVAVQDEAEGSGLASAEYRLLNATTGAVLKDWTMLSVGAAGTFYIDVNLEGQVKVEARGTDYAGNVSAVVSKLSRLDWSSPKTTISTPKTWSNQAANVTIQAADGANESGLAKAEYRLSGATTQNWKEIAVSGTSASTSFSVGTPGITLVEVRSYDIAGNISDIVSEEVKIETNAPLLYLENETNWSKEASVPVNVISIDSESGVASLRYQLNNGAANGLALASPVINVNQEGETSVSVYATDAAGNQTKTPATTTVRIDRTAPTLVFKRNGAVVSQETWTGSAFNLTVEGSDALSGVATLELPDGSVIYGNSATYYVGGPGKYTMTLTDKAGNQTTKTFVVSQPNVDAPDVSIETNSAWTSAAEVDVTFSGTPAASVKGLEYDLKGATVLDWEYVKMNPNSNPNRHYLRIQNEGVTTIQARVMNAYGTVSGIETRQVNIDRTAVAPSVSVVDGWSNANPLAIQIQATDNLSGIARVEYRFAKTGQAQPSTWTRLNVNWGNTTQTTLNWTQQGDYTLEVRLVDNAGNVSTSSTVQVRSDYEKPTLKLTGSGAYTNGNVTVEANATDTGGSGIAYLRYRLINDETGGLVQNWETIPMVLNDSVIVVRNEGVTRVEAYAIDHAGNESAIVTTVVRINRLAPVLNLTATTAWSNQDVSILVNAIDKSGAGINYIERPDGTKHYGASTTYVANVSDVYTFKTVDKAGNETKSEVTIRIDRDKPNLTVQVDEGWRNQSSVTAYVEATDDDSGIKSIEYRLNGGSWKSVVNQQITITQAGESSLEVRATDLAGNVTVAPTKYLRLETIKPTLSVTPDKTTWTNQPVYVTLKGTTKGAAPINRLVLPDNNVVFTDELIYPINTNGTYSFKALDAAGNQATQSLVVSNIDTAGPTITLSHNGSSGANDSVVITATFADALSGLSQLTLPDGSVKTVDAKTQTVQFPITVGGTYVFSATDKAGNVSSHALTLHNVGTSNLKLNLSETDAVITYRAEKINKNGPKFYRVELPNGLYSYKESDTYVATTNGLYTFIAYDYQMNETRESIFINSVKDHDADTTPPTHEQAIVTDAETEDGTHYWVQANNRFGIKLRATDAISTVASTNLRLTSTQGKTSTLQAEHVWDTQDPMHVTEWVKDASLAVLGVNETLKTDLSREVLFSLMAITDGQVYEAFVTYKDGAKNQSQETKLPFTIQVDGEAPTGTSYLSDTNIPNPTISVIGTDKGSGMDYILLPTGEKVSGNTATYEAKATGRYEFILVDKVGNQTKYPVYVVGSTGDLSSVMPVTRYPDIDLLLKASDVHPSKSGSSDVRYGSGIQAKRFKTNDGAWGSWILYKPNADGADITAANILTNGGAEGVNTYYTQVRDFATNLSSVVESKVLLDQTGPVITRFTAQPKYTNSNTVQVQLAASDNFEDYGLTGVQYIALSNDQKTWQLYNSRQLPVEVDWTVPVTAQTPNAYYPIYAKAIDSLGNEGPIKTAEYGVDTIAPTGGVVIGDGSEYATSKSTHLTLTYEDNFSGVEWIRIYDKGSDPANAYLIENPEGTELEIPWVLKPQTINGKQVGQVVMELVDRAGNKTTLTSQQVLVMDLTITDYTILNVINPKAFNATTPFKPMSYPSFGAQPMMAGGDYTYEFSYNVDGLALEPTWRAVYSIDYEMVSPNYRYTDQQVFKGEAIDGHFSTTYTMPYALETGVNIYTSVRVDIVNASGTILASDRLPAQTGALMHIGYVEGNIRELLQFNEIN